MLAILWLIVWATVGDAFYDDYNWYTSDDGATAFESQREIRDNFSDILRSFGDSYIPTREGDDEMTLAKAKSRLRMVKLFSHTGSPKDFEPNKGQVLPLPEGARFCTMGRHTKVDCNHCTCVAGQLYMCTGMVCPKPPAKPQSLVTCKEGKRRKIDSCNYCYCRNGHEICSTRDCRLHHDLLLVRSQYTCHEGTRRKIACNRCLCLNGEEYCTQKKCTKKNPTQLMLKQEIKQDNQMPEGHCNDGQTLKIDCRVCKCAQNRWHCSDKNCGVKKKPEDLTWLKCREGTTRPLDACNTCYCYLGQEFCEKKVCDEEEQLQYYRNLRYGGSQCDEGTHRKIDSCNYCLCINGTEMCTTKSCQENDLHLLRGRQDCDSGDVKYQDCNRCECQGRRWVCTKKLCNGDASQDLETEGEGGLQNNNNYLLNAIESLLNTENNEDNEDIGLNGIDFKFLRGFNGESIPPDEEPEESEESEEPKKLKNPEKPKKSEKPESGVEEVSCKKGSKKKVDCNACICHKGLWMCQVKHCGLPVADKEVSCKKGSRKKVDCNACICPNGLWMCQVKHCGPPVAALPSVCVIHSKVIVNCVPCYCTKEGWRCYLRRKKRNCKPDEKKGPPARSQKRLLRISNSNDDYDDEPEKCKIGERNRVDACNYCYCNRHREQVCTNNNCTVPMQGDDRFPKGDDRYPLSVGEKRCKIGSRLRKGVCNYCYCNYDRQLVCSENHCRRNLRTGLTDEKEVLRFTPAPKICLPNERFRIDNCNWCYCNATRHRVCERNLPCNRTKPDTRWPPNSPRKGCFIGSRFEWGQCGYCYCTVWRKIECLFRYNCTIDPTTTTTPKPTPKPKQISDPPKGKNTKPRKSFNFECEVGQIQRIDDCNFCRCTFNRQWTCSDNVCSSNHDHHDFLVSKTKYCTHGLRRQVDTCNYCVCHRGVEFCTRKKCWKDTGPTILSEPECLVGDPVPAPDPCNLCICLDSDILCTDNPCIQRQSDGKESSCIEGHKYRMDDGCNFCLCQGGQEFCTSRACLVRDKVMSAACNEGEVTLAEDRCNMCVCMKGKTICTNKHCSRRNLEDLISESFLSYIRTNKNNKPNQGAKRRCNPGHKYFPKDFDPNCPNECICDRHELLCTKRKCYNNWDKHTPFKWPLGRVEKKNRNAKQFLKQDCDEYQKMASDGPCNSCMCLNGRKVCTIVSCTDDIDGELGSTEAKISNNPRGIKGNKGNMVKKKNFCEPFTFFSPDNNRFCRNCFCLHNGLALCLLNLCKYSKDIPHQNSPEELDEVCTPGETGYPTKCVTCTCSEHGKWICTREDLAMCHERDCDEKDEFHMGFSPYCAGCKCAVKEWFCSIQSETCRDYSNATCPIGSFIRNPRQHCSICLCGGYEPGSHNMCFTEAKCVRQVISQLKL